MCYDPELNGCLIYFLRRGAPRRECFVSFNAEVQSATGGCQMLPVSNIMDHIPLVVGVCYLNVFGLVIFSRMCEQYVCIILLKTLSYDR